MNTLFPERVARLEYLIRLVIWAVILGVVFKLLLQMAEAFGISDWLPFIVFVLLFLMRFPFADIPRCRDIGWPPSYALLLLVPAVNIFIALWLFFRPSQRGDA